ncbi:hypothetical protein VTL71DRAFT_13040 [Oculimacula yallundae]|uniref:Heterokaryon incompatibility domain-containing protein n=1 Tax=Oculimacula yallundae TaxID=86028 RepID=A0ABR4CPE7_9HELO
MLCTFCSSIDLDLLCTVAGYKHHASGSDLYESSRNGCPSCKLIWDQHWESVGGNLSNGHLDTGPLEKQIIVRAMHQSPGNIQTLRYGQEERMEKYKAKWNMETLAWEKESDVPYLWTFLAVAAYPGSWLIAICWHLLRDRSAEYLSFRPFVKAKHTKDIWLPFVKSWLQGCCENHNTCPSADFKARLPSRVIDVGSSQEAQDPYLYTSAEESGEWVTLSHCWGQRTPLQTTRETLSAHQAALCMHTLPPLFRDAVTITRELGYKYLWIDSLCIVQDSEEDRTREIAEMGTIYKNSVLTISADNCLNCNDNILGPPSPARDISYTEQGCFSSKNTFRSKMYTFPRSVVSRSDSHSRDVEVAKSRGLLRTRAWTLQELVLSPRTVQWLPFQVEWSCRHTILSEQTPSEANNATEGRKIAPFSGISTRQHNSPKMICLSNEQLQMTIQQPKFKPLGCLDERNDPLQIWYVVAQEFLRRNITYESDALPAISGLAREVHRHTRHDYVVGLWAQDMHNGLLWSIQDAVKELESYVGPSWSWISIAKGPMNNLCAAALGPERTTYIYDVVDVKLLPIAEVLATHIDYVTSDHYGPIRSASLQLKAPCRAINAFAENDIVFPLISDFQQDQTYGVDPSGHRVLDGSIKCWLDDRAYGEKNLDDVRCAVERLKEEGIVVVMIASLDKSRILDVDSGGDYFKEKSRRILDNQNWCLLLRLGESRDVQDGAAFEKRLWQRIGVARVADNLLRDGWETKEITII